VRGRRAKVIDVGEGYWGIEVMKDEAMDGVGWKLRGVSRLDVR
jgi:hypothetical protein